MVLELLLDILEMAPGGSSYVELILNQVAVNHSLGEGKSISPPRGGRGALKGHEAVVEEAVVKEAVVVEAVEPPPGPPESPEP